MSGSLAYYYQKIEEALKVHLESHSGEIPVLEEAMEVAVLNGGRRIRPLLALMVASQLPHPEAALPAALSTEFFHAASLVADDLPMMDDAETRRDHPALHAIYGEQNALLVSYALISEGFQMLGDSFSIYPEEEGKGKRLAQAIYLASLSTGLKGATGGQYLDLNVVPTTVDGLLDLLKRKTAALFHMAFGMGWIFGGGDLSKLSIVEQAAYDFGLGFQLADDLMDDESDRLQGKGFNLCHHLGRKRVKELLEETSENFKEAIKTLGLDASLFEELSISLQVV